MNKALIIGFCIALYSSCLFGQSLYNDHTFYNGTIVLKNGELKKGLFRYKQTEETLFFKNGISIIIDDALYFQFYDHKQKFNRYFFSLVDQNKEEHFYELLLSGEINLYKKDYLVESDNIDVQQTQTNFNLDDVVVSKLFYESNKVLIEITDFENQVLPLMKDQINEVSAYIVSNQLLEFTISDQINIIDFYNEMRLKK